MRERGIEERQQDNRASRRVPHPWALLIFVPWIAAILFGLDHWYDAIQLDKKAKTTSGIITRIEHENHGQFDYEYSVNGTSYQGGEIIPGNTSLGTGQPVLVNYDPDAPEISTLGTFGETGTRPVPLVLCVVGGLYCYLRLRWYLKKRDQEDGYTIRG